MNCARVYCYMLISFIDAPSDVGEGLCEGFSGGKKKNAWDSMTKRKGTALLSMVRVSEFLYCPQILGVLL